MNASTRPADRPPQKRERYTGVRALFNADLHTAVPEWAPREHWRVIDSETIELIPDVG